MNDENRILLWSCSHCGPSPLSRATWCARGCGRDYLEMSQVEVVGDKAK